MKIVMLEPLGVPEDVFMEDAKRFTDAGHEFVFCGAKVSDDEKKALIKDADVAIIANSPLPADVINAGEKLKLLSVGFTGIDHVDVEACKAKGVMVCNAQGYATEATAELAVGLMLASLRNIVPYDKVTREGGTLAGYVHNTLNGKTVGIIGTGAIGLHTAKLVKAFGASLIGYSRTEKDEAKALGLVYKGVDEVFKEADIVSLHVPFTPETKHIASKARIDSMKETAILINCGRGPLVDSEALADALNNGRIAKAGIDVFETEPPIDKAHPLFHAKNCIVTPHVGFYSQESLKTRVGIVCDNVSAWMDGKPINVRV